MNPPCVPRRPNFSSQADDKARAGNHDMTLDEAFYSEQGHNFHNANVQDTSRCVALLRGSPSLTYLCHESATIRLASPAGPRTTFKVFGSPRSPAHPSGICAFAYAATTTTTTTTPGSELTSAWDDVPLDADVVVTHTPMRTHCDETSSRRAAGCEALRRQMWRVRPRLAVCGHVHEGRGAERVSWDLSSRNVGHAEGSVATWNDPGQGNNKLSLVDLTGRRAPSLANDGSHPASSSSSSSLSSSAAADGVNSTSGVSGPGDAQLHGTIGLGGDPSASSRCDGEALSGRMGRRETCVINAAIMAVSYPHIGGKKLNKPIVVDLDLPIWDEEPVG